MANTILVNVGAQNPMHAIVGHELGHNMKAQKPDLWAALRDAVPTMKKGYREFKESQGYRPEQVIDEWVSDMLADRFDNAEFWTAMDAALARKTGTSKFGGQVGIARQAAEWMTGWLSRIVRRIRNIFVKIKNPAFALEMEAINDRVGAILADYAEMSNTLPERAQDSDDAALSIGDDITLAAATEGQFEEGREYSRFPDSLRERGQPVDRIEYEVRSQKEAAAEAKRVIESRGEKAAEAEALDRSSTIAGDTRVAVIGELIGRRAAELKGAKPEDVARITKEMNRLVAAAQPSLATEAGQQISMFQHVYKDPRVAAVMEYTKDVQDRQKRQMGEATDKAVDEAVSTLNEAAREAAKSIEKNLPQVLRPVKVGRSIWQRYRDSVAEKLVKMVEDRTTPPADQPPLADFTRRVAEQIRTRMEPILPEQATSARPQPSTMEIIREAMENKAKYRDVFDTVRTAFVEQYGADSVIVESIDQVLGDIGVRPYSEKLLKKATREAFEAMKLNVRELARQHVTKTNATAAQLADALVNVAGLTGADAKQVAADLDATARELIAASRQKALDALKRRHDTPKAKKVLDAISRTTELNNLGALARQDLADVVAKTLRLPSVDPERMQRISEIADRVETAENASLRAKAETELLNELRRARGITKTDVATAVWFANMLSGYTTQLANVQGNAFNGILQLATVAAANPRQMGQAVRGYIEGFGEGWTQAKAIVKTGRGSREFDAKTGTASPTLELVDYTKDFPDLNKTIAKGLNAHARVLSYVFRFMKAVDATFYYPAREAYARVVTTKLLAAEYQGPELHRKVREMLGVAPDQFVAAQKRAKAEGFTGVDLALRVSNIIEETRRGSDIGRTAAEQSERFALETTFNNEPEGWAGVLYQHLAKLTEGFRPGGVPVLKAFLPFLRIPTNLFNASMNYTPIGAVRAMRGVVKPELVGEKVEIERREFTEDERNRLLVQSIGGSLAMGALAAMALQGAAD
ncbi:MAG TPA: hypothetical protein VHF69_09690, partial [Candidatus Synoicihabitans sp.]|nr:hypothetical protein [Candidatus Synoicihabitans sp.]